MSEVSSPFSKRVLKGTINFEMNQIFTPYSQLLFCNKYELKIQCMISYNTFSFVLGFVLLCAIILLTETFLTHSHVEVVQEFLCWRDKQAVFHLAVGTKLVYCLCKRPAEIGRLWSGVHSDHQTSLAYIIRRYFSRTRHIEWNQCTNQKDARALGTPRSSLPQYHALMPHWPMLCSLSMPICVEKAATTSLATRGNNLVSQKNNNPYQRGLVFVFFLGIVSKQISACVYASLTHFLTFVAFTLAFTHLLIRGLV